MSRNEKYLGEKEITTEKEETLEEKKQYLNEIKNFLSESKSKINQILTTLNWDEETILKNETKNVENEDAPEEFEDKILEIFDWDIETTLKNEKEINIKEEEKEEEGFERDVQCPIDANHVIPINYFEKHFVDCFWKSLGYDKDDKPLSIPSVSGPSTLKIDSSLINSLFKKSSNQKDDRQFPKTYNRLLTDFTPQERLKLYKYSIENTKFEMPEEISFETNQSKEENETPSYLELKAKERDAKRRRISYKNRKVHTKNKSHAEIMREVIKNQMEIYEEWLKSKNPELDDSNTKEVEIKTNKNLNLERPRPRTKERELHEERIKSRERSKNYDRYSYKRETYSEIDNFPSKSSNYYLHSGKRKYHYDSSDYTSFEEHDEKRRRSSSHSKKHKKHSKHTKRSSSEDSRKEERHRKKHKKEKKKHEKRSHSRT